MSLRFACASIAFLAPLAFSSCETMSRAPQGSPRLELEVAVNMDESYTGKLAGAGQDLARAVADLVLGHADLGLRFYPTLSTRYGPKDPRPEYLLSVDIRDLEVLIDHKTTRVEGAEPVTTQVVKQIDCGVSATLTKRRPTGPALVVGRTDGKGSAMGLDGGSTEAKTVHNVKRAGSDAQPVTVRSEHLLAATERGLTRALSGLVAPVDRELAMLNKSTAAPAAPPQ